MANSNKGEMMKFLRSTLAITAGILFANVIQRQMMSQDPNTTL